MLEVAGIGEQVRVTAEAPNILASSQGGANVRADDTRPLAVHRTLLGLAELLAGAAKISMEPRPGDYGGTWETDQEACETFTPSEAGLSGTVTHALGADTRVKWAENPDCIYMGGYGIGPMNAQSELMHELMLSQGSLRELAEQTRVVPGLVVEIRDGREMVATGRQVTELERPVRLHMERTGESGGQPCLRIGDDAVLRVDGHDAVTGAGDDLIERLREKAVRIVVNASQVYARVPLQFNVMFEEPRIERAAAARGGDREDGCGRHWSAAARGLRAANGRAGPPLRDQAHHSRDRTADTRRWTRGNPGGRRCRRPLFTAGGRDGGQCTPRGRHDHRRRRYRWDGR